MSESEQLTALDATFLELEQEDGGALMHIGAALVFGPLPNGHPPDVEEIRAQVTARLPLLPRYSQRLSTPRTGGLSWPSWESAPHFVVADHIRHATLPAPGGRLELLDWVADFYSHPLDRARPLWELAFVDGLADEQWALVLKTHHCLVDGVAGMEMLALLLDREPGQQLPDSPPTTASASTVNGHESIRQAAQAGLAAGRAAGHAVLHPREALRRSAAVVDLLLRDELLAAPHCSLNVPIGATRRMDAVSFPLDACKQIRAELGGTINDVVLAAATGGLRSLLLSRGETPPAAGLRAMVPVDVRIADGNGKLGNKVSSLFVDLPVDEQDALRRYQRVHASTTKHKHGPDLLGAETVVALGELAPPVLHAALARSSFGTRLFNVTITNVPGPRDQLYAHGAPLIQMIPLVPLASEHAVGVAIVSYAGELIFGLVADRSSVPDLDVFADGIFGSLVELSALANRAGGESTQVSASVHDAPSRT